METREPPAGLRGLARCALRQAARPHPGVRRHRADGPGPRDGALRGQFWTLPLPDGPGKALRLTVHPARTDIPRLPRRHRAEEPRADRRDRRRLAGHLLRPGARRRAAGPRRGRAEPRPARPSTGSTSCRRCRSSSVGDDLEACAAPLRHYAALYVGGMGSREQNFYNRLAVSMGYAEAAARVQDLYLAAQPPGRGRGRAVRVHRPHLADRPARSASATGCTRMRTAA